MLVTTVALGLCLVLVSLMFTGFTQGERIAMHALQYLGRPYVFGAEGPKSFDCSGLIMYVMADEGIVLPHSAEIMGTDESHRKLENPRDLLTGDIVCFDTICDSDPSAHVGIWLGANQFVHASSGKGEVTISSLEGYYLEHFTGARRMVQVYF